MAALADIPYSIAGLVSILANGDPSTQRRFDHLDEVSVAQNRRGRVCHQVQGVLDIHWSHSHGLVVLI